MKPLIILMFCFLNIKANATTYYFAKNGNDENTGTSTSSTWQTIKKLNSAFWKFRPGDSILFKRGDIFYGNIIINQSGVAGSPITIGAYGSGANPVITGFRSITSWTNLSGNIWEEHQCNFYITNLQYGYYKRGEYSDGKNT